MRAWKPPGTAAETGVDGSGPSSMDFTPEDARSRSRTRRLVFNRPPAAAPVRAKRDRATGEVLTAADLRRRPPPESRWSASSRGPVLQRGRGASSRGCARAAGVRPGGEEDIASPGEAP
mmetsp:Transcript_27639/g.82451  ORF Transcript_27639/g.82451 Transcript_27639/m.82451 type:complete len:119 (-) Transcript_27639:51-407(-)